MSKVSGCLIPGCEWGCKNQSEHYTRLKGVTNRPKPPVTTPESVTKRPKEAVSTEKSVTKSVTKSDKDRVKAWREKNRAKYNEKQKELMRKRVK